jgi:DNA-binding MarR family transcriptional regulator
MDSRLPLPTLLSHALVAFTIEFDNESEHQLPHSTARHGSTPGALFKPWLVSMAMWFNCMQFIDDEGVTVGAIERLARTSTNLNGMQRWGYIHIAPDPADKRPKPPRSAWLIHATPAGRQAQKIWGPLVGVIEKRWQERFGKDALDRLRESLSALADKLDPDLPDCLPILAYALVTKLPERTQQASAIVAPTAISDLPLPALLSRVLLALALDFERNSEVSLAISANVLRLVGDEGVRLRDLPLISAVSKEAIATSISFLKRHGFATEEPESPGSRVKLLKLTPKGLHARDEYHHRLSAIEQQWRTQCSAKTLDALRKSLEKIVGEPTAESSPLFRGLEPYPEGWRASLPKPKGLPHYPMVLHRGGFPDGS